MPWARRTERLGLQITKIGLAQGRLPGSRLTKHLGIFISRQTLLRLVPNHLLLAHSPAYRDLFSSDELAKIRQYKPQYMLSGHTHGGQLSLFGFTPIRSNGSGRYVSGWYRDGAIAMYVSRGLGVSILPVRIGVVPEIGYFEWYLN